MKNLPLSIVVLFFTITTFSQTKMRITLNDGTVTSGIFRLKNTSLGWKIQTKLISKKEKYSLKDIEKITMYIDSDSIGYEVLSTKKYLDSKKTKLKLGQIGFKGDSIELFYTYELVYQGGTTQMFTTVSSYTNAYVRRKGENIAYNMGYIYGAAQRGIKKRVRDYFTDCPELIHKVGNNVIHKDETLEIALFYERNCKDKSLYQ